VVPKDLERRIQLSHQRHAALKAAWPTATPPAYDARTLGYVTAVDDQGQCGDCWNFAGTDVAAMANIIAGNATAADTDWSKQSVLDCGSNGGCNGDWPETALEQCKNSGVANTSDYPYTGGVGPCQNVPHPNLIADYGYVGPTRGVPPVQDIKSALLAHGPLSVALAVDDAWENYTGGIFAGSPGLTDNDINHAIKLVGWQDDATLPAGGSWIVQNNWGTGWGEAGYMRCQYGANLVGFAAMFAIGRSPAA
jgi:C1A family cysteine protease